MIEISLDVGDVPYLLARLTSPQTMQRVSNAAAQTYVDEVHDWIDAGHGYHTRNSGNPRSTGQLQQSINWTPENGGAVVFANADYAPYVEFGTRAHVIRPKPGRKALKIPVGNGYIFRREVHHPGGKPYPYFFADQAGREAAMADSVRYVLNSVIANG